MGAALGCDPDVVDTAGLAHDLGHPPFGHNGEDALDVVAAALRRVRGQRADAAGADPARGQGPRAGRRAGRAQPHPRGRWTRACKYPWPRRDGPSRKFGVYADDAAVFDWVRAGAPDGRRCLEAQVMDWADDVAYSVHDVEDGIHAGYVTIERAADPASGPRSCELAADGYSGRARRRPGRRARRAARPAGAARPGRLRRQPRRPGRR